MLKNNTFWLFSQYTESTRCLHLFKFRKGTAAGCLLCVCVCVLFKRLEVDILLLKFFVPFVSLLFALILHNLPTFHSQVFEIACTLVHTSVYVHTLGHIWPLLGSV